MDPLISKDDIYLVICPSCKHCSLNLEWCSICRNNISPFTMRYLIKGSTMRNVTGLNWKGNQKCIPPALTAQRSGPIKNNRATLDSDLALSIPSANWHHLDSENKPSEASLNSFHDEIIRKTKTLRVKLERNKLDQYISSRLCREDFQKNHRLPKVTCTRDDKLCEAVEQMEIQEVVVDKGAILCTHVEQEKLKNSLDNEREYYSNNTKEQNEAIDLNDDLPKGKDDSYDPMCIKNEFEFNFLEDKENIRIRKENEAFLMKEGEIFPEQKIDLCFISKEKKEVTSQRDKDGELCLNGKRKRIYSINKKTDICLRSKKHNSGEKVSPEKKCNDKRPTLNHTDLLPDYCILKCHSLSIGSFKVKSKVHSPSIRVVLTLCGISFDVPRTLNSNVMIAFTLRSSDISSILVHFGTHLPIIISVLISPSCGKNMKKLLISANKFHGVNRPSKDKGERKILFLVDKMKGDQCGFLRCLFAGEKKVKEISEEKAYEILKQSAITMDQLVKSEGKLDCGNSVQKMKRSESATKQGQLVKSEDKLDCGNSDQKIKRSPETATKQDSSTVNNIQCLNSRMLVYPPPPFFGGIVLSSKDIACLNKGEYFNDSIIDFYMKYIYYEKISDYQREKTHIFSSYFFNYLIQESKLSLSDDNKSRMINRRRVNSWTRRVDIFSKDFIIIPLNRAHHWFLVVICFPGKIGEVQNVFKETDISSSETNNAIPVIILGDSCQTPKEESNIKVCISESSSSPIKETELQKSSRKQIPCICFFNSMKLGSETEEMNIADLLREFLAIEWEIKKGTDRVYDWSKVPSFRVSCPQQSNSSDCGVYVLQFVDSFFEKPIPYFRNPMPDLSNWFPASKVAEKRKQIKELVLNLQQKFENSAIASSVKSKKPCAVSSHISDSKHS